MKKVFEHLTTGTITCPICKRKYWLIHTTKKIPTKKGWKKRITHHLNQK